MLKRISAEEVCDATKVDKNYCSREQKIITGKKYKHRKNQLMLFIAAHTLSTLPQLYR